MTDQAINTSFLPIGNDYKVKVIDTYVSDYYDFSDSEFSIIAASDLSRWLLTPNGGQVYDDKIPISINHNIYSPSDLTVEVYNGVQLVYSPESGLPEQEIDIVEAGIPTGHNYKIKVSDTNNPGLYVDESDMPFTVIHNATPPGPPLLTDLNYVRNYNPTEPMIDDNIVLSSNVDQVAQSTTFFDGLGRQRQVVQKGISVLGKDLIITQDYDAFSNLSKEYLPYTDISTGEYHANYLLDQADFYQLQDDAITNTLYPYTLTEYELSPLARPKSKYAPGEDWQMHPQSFNYKTNFISTIPILSSSGSTVELLGFYDVDKLFITSAKDENGNESLEYKNNQGNVVFKASIIPDPSVPNTYNDYNPAPFNWYDFVVNIRGGSGNVTVDISDNVLAVNFNTVFTATELITGPVKQLNTNPPIPDMALGPLASGAYTVSVKNGWLTIEGSGEVSRLNGNFTKDLSSFGMPVTTYYVYDALDNLSTVISPQGFKSLEEASFFETVGGMVPADILDKYCFQYKYDGRRRMTEKKIPGAEPVKMIYDDRDRLVLTQDGNQRNENKWLFTKYDALNRPIITGEKLLTASESTLRDLLDGTDWLQNYAAYETLGGDKFGYTSNSLPKNITTDEILTVTYYDDYTFPHASAYPFVPELGNTAVFDQVKGQVTDTKIKILDGSNTWLDGVTYYDNRYRVIQSQTETLLGGVDRVTNLYDFIGQVLETKTTHETSQVFDIEWTDVTGATVNAENTLTKTLGNAWNAGAGSSNLLSAGENGWVEMEVQNTNAHMIFGLSDTNSDVSYSTIDYGLYLRVGGSIRIYENGSNRGTFGAYATGDKLILLCHLKKME